MTQAQKISKLEDEMAKQKRTIDFLLEHFRLKPNLDELEQAVAALTAGDPSALDSYLTRGGQIIKDARDNKYTKTSGRL